MVPPCSDRISRVPPYSRIILRITHTGLSPATARLSKRFCLSPDYHWPGPRSLATTSGVSVDVLSSGYLDVSVPRVRLCDPMYSGTNTFIVISASPKTYIPYNRQNRLCPASSVLGITEIEGGFPHSEIRGSKLLRSSSRLIAA